MDKKETFNLVRYDDVNNDNKIQTIEATDEFNNKRSIQRYMYYGVSSVPPKGTRALIANEDDNPSNASVIAENDALYTPTSDELEEGEIMLYTLNNKDDNKHKITMKKDGSTVMECNTTKITINNDNTIDIVSTAGVNVRGNVNVRGDVIADNISLKNHVHGQNNGSHYGGGVDTSGPK